MKRLFYPLLNFILLLTFFSTFLGCSSNESRPAKEEVVEKREEQNSETALISKSDSPEDQDTIKDSIRDSVDDGALRFYSNLVHQMNPDHNYELQMRGAMNFPSSLAEDLEGGAIIPHVIELSNAGGLVGLIAYQEKQPFPLTFSMALPVIEDGFTLPIVHYEIVDINHTPVLRVIRSISGLLTEGPFQQAYYNMRGQGKGVVPMHVSTGEIMTDQDQKAVGNWIVHAKFPAGSYSQDCPSELNEGKAQNTLLEFQHTGILAKTEYTGFSTNFFYYFTSDSTISCWPLEKYMISPDDERIEEELTKAQQEASWKKVEFTGANVIELTSSSSMLPSSYFCRIP